MFLQWEEMDIFAAKMNNELIYRNHLSGNNFNILYRASSYKLRSDKSTSNNVGNVD